jgi:hypothetical protein
MILSGKKLIAYKLNRILDMVAMCAIVFIAVFLLMAMAIGIG